MLWCEAWRGDTGVAHSLPVLPCLWWRSHTGDVVEFLYFCLISLHLFAADDLVDIMKCKYSKYFIKKLLIYGFVFHWFTWNILLISSYTVWTAINCSQWGLLLFVVHRLILSSTQFLQDWTGLSPYHFVFSFLFKINSSVCGNEELTGGGLVCGKALVFINIVALRWAQLILGWVSVCGM